MWLEKDWLKAVEAARRRGEISSRSYQVEIAPFLLRLAASEIAHSDHAQHASIWMRRCG